MASADAVFSNLRGDQPERLRLRYPDLAPVNPRIVCVALTGYGSAPDQALLPGYDALVQAESGWASLTGDPDGPPTKSGLSLADYICGLTAMVGLLAGLRDADRTGLGPRRGHQPVRQRARDARPTRRRGSCRRASRRGGCRCRRIRPWCRSSSSPRPTATSRSRVPRRGSSSALVRVMGLPELADGRAVRLVLGARQAPRRGAGAPRARGSRS